MIKTICTPPKGLSFSQPLRRKNLSTQSSKSARTMEISSITNISSFCRYFSRHHLCTFFLLLECDIREKSKNGESSVRRHSPPQLPVSEGRPFSFWIAGENRKEDVDFPVPARPVINTLSQTRVFRELLKPD